MTKMLTIPADTATAIADLAVSVKCEELAYNRAIQALHDAEDGDDRRTLKGDNKCWRASQVAEDAARKLAARLAQVARFQDNMLGGFEAIQKDAKFASENWNATADRLQGRADMYHAQIAKAMAA